MKSEPTNDYEAGFEDGEAKLEKANAQLRADLADAERQLWEIDAMLARRTALDGLTRIEKIQLALNVACATDPKGDIANRLRGHEGSGEG